jgi:hypothetical protein
MKKLIRKLMVLGMLGIFTVSAFAQGKGGDKRPPKDPGKVVTPDKRGNQPQRPPQEDKRPKKDDKRRP